MNYECKTCATKKNLEIVRLHSGRLNDDYHLVLCNRCSEMYDSNQDVFLLNYSYAVADLSFCKVINKDVNWNHVLKFIEFIAESDAKESIKLLELIKKPKV